MLEFSQMVTEMNTSIEKVGSANVTTIDGADYIVITSHRLRVTLEQFPKVVEYFTSGRSEEFFGPDAKDILIRSFFGHPDQVRIPKSLIDRLGDRREEFAKNILEPIFQISEINARNRGLLDIVQGESKKSISIQTKLKNSEGLDVEYELCYLLNFGKNDPTTRLGRVLNTLLEENAISYKYNYNIVNKIYGFSIFIDDTTMEKIHKSPNFDKIVEALKNPEKSGREHRKGDWVGRVRNLIEEYPASPDRPR